MVSGLEKASQLEAKGDKGLYVRRMFPSQPADQAGVTLASFAHGIVARVEVLALLEFVLQQVLLVWKLAVQAEELLFFFREFLHA